MAANKIVNGYWLGYQANGNTLDQTPSYFNTVTLFVAAPTASNELGVNYLCSAYPQTQQIAWVQQLQSQGTEVLMSLMDTPTVHWNDIDITAFAQNVVATAINGPWGLNGIDIDLESRMPGAVWAYTFEQLISAFRTALGPLGQTNKNGQVNSRLSVAAYNPGGEEPVLKAVGNQLDWLNTMAYPDNAAENEQLFKTYSKWVAQINLGVAVPPQPNNDYTPLANVQPIAQYAAATSNCGMMEFALNNDCPYYNSGEPQWAWASAIEAGLTG